MTDRPDRRSLESGKKIAALPGNHVIFQGDLIEQLNREARSGQSAWFIKA